MEAAEDLPCLRQLSTLEGARDCQRWKFSEQTSPPDSKTDEALRVESAAGAPAVQPYESFTMPEHLQPGTCDCRPWVSSMEFKLNIVRIRIRFFISLPKFTS